MSDLVGINYIDFRIWAPGLGRMTEPQHLALAMDQVEELAADDPHSKNGSIEGPHVHPWVMFCRILATDEAVMLRSSGLKDKNGVKIYEGDIVADHYHKNHISRHKVYWADNFACFATINLKNSIIDRYQLGTFNESKNAHRNEYLEVIGNIYENPELIK